MSTRTISLRIEAYERLERARSHPGESFSDVVMRAVWSGRPFTGGDYLRLMAERGPVFGAAELDELSENQTQDTPAPDKQAAD